MSSPGSVLAALQALSPEDVFPFKVSTMGATGLSLGVAAAGKADQGWKSAPTREGMGVQSDPALPGGSSVSCTGLGPRELAPDLLVGCGLDHKLGCDGSIGVVPAALPASQSTEPMGDSPPGFCLQRGYTPQHPSGLVPQVYQPPQFRCHYTPALCRSPELRC